MSQVSQLIGRIESEFSGQTATQEPSRPGASVPADPLVAALADVARHYGIPISSQALIAGLPLEGGRLPLEHAAAAAERAGLDVRLAEVDPLTLADNELPVIVPLTDGRVCLLQGVTRARRRAAKTVAISIAGRLDEKAEMSADAFKKLSTGRILRVRPQTALDERGSSAGPRRANSWFLAAFRGSRRIYAEAIVATIVINILALAMPLFTMNVYDRVLPNAAAETMWALAIGVVLATLFDFTIKMLRANFVDTASRRADIKLANFIYGRLLSAKLPERPVSAGVRANALRELETVRDFFNSLTLTAFGDVPFLVLYLAVIWVIAGPLMLVGLVAVPLVICAGLITQRVLSRHMQASFQETAQKNAVVVETLVGLETIKSAGAESWAAGKWEQAVSDHIRTGLRIRKLSNLGVHVVQAAQVLTQVAMVLVGFYMVAAGQITAGALIASTMLIGRALGPLGAIAMIISRLHQTRLAYRALGEVANAPQERPVGVRFLSKSHFAGQIDADDVTFSYEREAPPALREVSFSIAAGERVGIIGAIGSGKTTILKLMQALHAPSRGQVFIDGVSVGHVDPALLRANVGLLQHGAELFHGSIRSNIALADPGAADDAILRAAHASGALDWIARLPAGFDTVVRERGVGLSAGQRQSVALARTLLKSPRVLLLDEPTSDMDGRTEQTVIRRLKEFAKDRTLVLVTHRPALLDLVDRLIVLDAGRKVADGPKERVLDSLKRETEKRRRIVTSTAPVLKKSA